MNIQPSRQNPLWCYELVSKLDWKIQNTFIWNKRIEIDGYVRGQGTTSQSKKYICNGWEYVFHLTKKGKTEISQKTVVLAIIQNGQKKTQNALEKLGDLQLMLGIYLMKR